MFDEEIIKTNLLECMENNSSIIVLEEALKECPINYKSYLLNEITKCVTSIKNPKFKQKWKEVIDFYTNLLLNHINSRQTQVKEPNFFYNPNFRIS